MNRLSSLLKQEQDEMRFKLQQQKQQKERRQFRTTPPAAQSSVFLRTVVSRDLRPSTQSQYPLESIKLQPLKPPLVRSSKLVNLKEPQKKEIEQTHFLCQIMQDQTPDQRKVVNQFLSGKLAMNSYDSIVQMESSAKTLHIAAKEMSKTLEYGNQEEEELTSLKEKFITSLKIQQYNNKKPQNLVFKRTYGQKHEMLIDQIGNGVRKRTDHDYDLFIPKEEMDQFIELIQKRIDDRLKVQQDELIQNEQQQIDKLVKDMKRFREEMREVTYTMNHLKGKKGITEHTLHTNESGYEVKRLTSTQARMDEEAKQDFRLRVRKALRNFMDKMKRVNISLDDIVNNQVFPSAPYERPNSHQFFQYVKMDNFQEVETMLKFSRFHVYDIDNQLKNPLHHAVTNNSFEMIKMLVEAGSDLDSRDMMGRTPLHLAAKNNHLDTVRMLLVYCSNPSIKTIAGKKASDLTKLPVIKAMLNNARKLHFMMELCQPSKRKDFWISKAVHFFHEQDPEKIIKLQLYKSQAKLFLN